MMELERKKKNNIKHNNINDDDNESLSRRYSMDFATIFSNKNVKHHGRHSANTTNPSSKNNSISPQSGETKDEDNGNNSIVEQKKQSSHIQYTFKIVQPKRSYSFCIIDDSKHFTKWIVKLEFCIFGNKLAEGYLFQLSERKKGKGREYDKDPKWMKRWFVIYSRQEMRYFDDETRKVPRGMVILTNLKSLTKTEDYKAKKKYGQLLYLLRLEFVNRKIIILACLGYVHLFSLSIFCGRDRYKIYICNNK